MFLCLISKFRLQRLQRLQISRSKGFSVTYKLLLSYNSYNSLLISKTTIVKKLM